MKTILTVIAATVLTCSLTACQDHKEKAPQPKVEAAVETTTSQANHTDMPAIKVGIVLPLEHKALNEIAAGFSDKLRQTYHGPVEIKVMNAQGDANMQRAIIQQMHDQHYTMIVPIATGAARMTASMVHNIPIIALAADFSDSDRHKSKPCNIAVVHDELPSAKIIELIHVAYPQIKHLTLIYSAEDKIFPEVKRAVAAGNENHIEIKPLMVATLPDLVSAAQALPDNTQGIFVLKDNLIVSGIATLAKVANDKHIPLITSDQGSVQTSAGFALGVHERQIGEEGASLAAGTLFGDSICTMPIVEMKKHMTVFINSAALKQEAQNSASIEAAAKTLKYNVEFVESGK